MIWRRRNEGFEWKDYVRTTILVRRRQRREKIEAVGQAAAEGLKQAGRAGLEAGAAGAEAAVQGVSQSTSTGVAFLRRQVRAARNALARASAPINPTLRRFAPAFAGLSLFCGAAAAIRMSQFGADRDALIMAVLALVAGVLWIWPRTFAADREDATEPAPQRHAARNLAEAPDITTRMSLTQRITARVPSEKRLPLGLAALFAALMVWLAAPVFLRWLPAGTVASDQGLQSAPEPAQEMPTDTTIKGAARVLDNGHLRLDGRRIELSAITLLDARQRCQRADGTSWPCGAVARAALKKAVRSRRDLTCVPVNSEDGITTATCSADGRDIAAELVRNGHAFADGLIWSTYGGEQAEAEARGAGLWSGTPERPADWKTRLWDEAVAKAPDGCPIKTRIERRRKVYLMPEDSDYARFQPRSARGESWFCSREDAEAAGFTARDPS